MKRIKAFTLIELMVVMVLSSIVFTIAYYAYRSVIIFQSSQTQASIDIEQYRTLNKLLANDLMDCDLSIQETENTIRTISRTKGDVTYYFGESSIVRMTADLATDTFQVRHPSSYVSTKYLSPEDRIINELELYLIFHDSPITLHFQKTYAPELLINKQIEALRNELH